MIANERDVRHEHILNVARQMMTAARTAPKGKGIDAIEVAMRPMKNCKSSLLKCGKFQKKPV